ncbi:MAG: right-handed parallel beta-helix repeat-containing protein, partial [Bacteroidales bacterium]|nr:right-handed parallel beta-helix repeat-containing protein [Bacteroidales bacterium]
MKNIFTSAVLLLLTCIYLNGQSKTYFISPFGEDSRSGLSVKDSWKTLDRVNQVIFQPGDQILFETGGIWYGQLKPQGSGEEGKPIILSSYGDGHKPVINIGRAEGAGIRLTNQSWWEISNMEITSGAPPETGIGRQGIVAVAKGENQQLKHIVVRNCYVHDIWGQMGGNTEYTGYYSCGILVNIQRERSRDRTRPVTTRIDDVLIENNRIERFDKCGIISWGPQNNVIVRNNVMDNLGGDGIFVNGPYRGIIERNVVRRSCMRSGNLDIPDSKDWWPHTAAIWIQNTVETVMQFNEVYDTGREKTNGDGNAYDFDFNCKNCICQYNYSRNNHGFLLIMNNTFGNIARYNISENDKTHLIQFQCDTTDRNLVHNNVFYVDYGTADLDYHSGSPDKSRLGAKLINNIFYATGQGRFRTVYTQGPMLTRQYIDTIRINYIPKTRSTISQRPSFITTVISDHGRTDFPMIPKNWLPIRSSLVRAPEAKDYLHWGGISLNPGHHALMPGSLFPLTEGVIFTEIPSVTESLILGLMSRSVQVSLPMKHWKPFLTTGHQLNPG